MTAEKDGMDALIGRLVSFKEALEHVLGSFTQRARAGEEGSEHQLDEPLNALADIASLWRAHTTKVGIAFKPPVSAAAAEACLQDVAKLLPLAAGVALSMTEARDGQLAVNEATARTRALVESQARLVDELASVAERQRLETASGRRPSASGRSSGATLTSIGKVWQSCDALAELKTLGVGGILRARIAEFAGMLDDAASDLEAWINGESTLDAFGDELEPAGAGDDATQALASQWHKKLTRLKILYNTISKRRATANADTAYLEAIYTRMHALSSLVDDLACEFMEGSDSESVTGTANRVDEEVRALIAHVKPRDDQFTTWVAQFEQHF